MADILTDMEVHMVANMEVDKVANMVADMVNDKESGRHGVEHYGRQKINIDINIEIQFDERVGHGRRLIRPKLFWPEAFLLSFAGLYYFVNGFFFVLSGSFKWTRTSAWSNRALADRRTINGGGPTIILLII